MNYKVKCIFCPTMDLFYDRQVSTTLDSSYRAQALVPADIYTCYACKAKFFYKGERLAGWDFRTTYKDNEFSFIWIETYGHINFAKNGIRIINLPSSTHITPYNALQKIPIILLFL
jgi:hypothetical protein